MAYVLVCGDRDWDDFGTIERRLRQLPKDTIIVEGDARGADKIAGWIAKHRLGLEVKPVPADWTTYGKAAGPIRNQKMPDDYPITLVLAFHNDLVHSKGTKDMVERAAKAGIPYEVITSVA